MSLSKPLLRALCATHISYFSEMPILSVYRLQDGSFHRVVAADDVIVVRVPRFEHVSLRDEAAVLAFIHTYSKMPVPRVLKLHTCPSNVVGAPYMVSDMLHVT